MEYLAEALLAFLTLAFLAWAGIVYSMGQRAIKLLADLKEDFAALKTEQKNLKDRVARHEQLSWHSRAGEQLSGLDARVTALERQ